MYELHKRIAKNKRRPMVAPTVYFNRGPRKASAFWGEEKEMECLL